MKIKSLNPVIVTPDGENLVRTWVELHGFRIIHHLHGFVGADDVEYVLENDEGVRMDIIYRPDAGSTAHQAIRLNVDNFDEALAYYLDRGFTVLAGPQETEHFRRALVRHPVDGGHCVIFEHKKH